jgi:hypothetical protein
MRMLGDLGLEAGDPDFKKLIEIGAHDTDVTQTLQGGCICALGHRQYALVELQKRQLTIEVQGFGFLSSGHLGKNLYVGKSGTIQCF